MQTVFVPNPRAIENKVNESIAFYHSAGRKWRYVHYLLGLFATIFAALPAAREIWVSDHPDMKLVGQIGAFGAPLMLSLMAFTQAKAYSDSWFLGWRILKTARCKYELGEISASELLAKWNDAEAIGIKDVRQGEKFK